MEIDMPAYFADFFNLDIGIDLLLVLIPVRQIQCGKYHLYQNRIGFICIPRLHEITRAVILFVFNF